MLNKILQKLGITDDTEAIYIAGGIKGQIGAEKRFKTAEIVLKETYKIVVNPLEIHRICCDIILEEKPWLTWLMLQKNLIPEEEIKKIDLEVLKHCKTMFLLKDWEQSEGAVNEWRFAVLNNIKILKEV